MTSNKMVTAEEREFKFALGQTSSRKWLSSVLGFFAPKKRRRRLVVVVSTRRAPVCPGCCPGPVMALSAGLFAAPDKQHQRRRQASAAPLKGQVPTGLIVALSLHARLMCQSLPVVGRLFAGARARAAHATERLPVEPPNNKALFAQQHAICEPPKVRATQQAKG